MRSKTILALILLNVALLATLFFHSFLPRASAVPPLGGGGKPSDYLMASGEVQGGNGGVVFIVDTRNDALTVFTFNGQKIDGIQPIDLARALK